MYQGLGLGGLNIRIHRQLRPERARVVGEELGIRREECVRRENRAHVGAVGHGDVDTLHAQRAPRVDGADGTCNDSFLDVGQIGRAGCELVSVDKVVDERHGTVHVGHDILNHESGIVRGLRDLDGRRGQNGFLEFAEDLGEIPDLSQCDRNRA